MGQIVLCDSEAVVTILVQATASLTYEAVVVVVSFLCEWRICKPAPTLYKPLTSVEILFQLCDRVLFLSEGSVVLEHPHARLLLQCAKGNLCPYIFCWDSSEVVILLKTYSVTLTSLTS